MVISALTETSDHIWASVALVPATENAAEQQQAAATVNVECKKGRWEMEKDERTGRQPEIGMHRVLWERQEHPAQGSKSAMQTLADLRSRRQKDLSLLPA